MGQLTEAAGRAALPRRVRAQRVHARPCHPRRPSSLVLLCEGRLVGLSFPLARLVDPLDDLLIELRVQVIRHGDLAAFDAASARQVRSLQWTLAACGAIAIVAAAWKMFAG